MTARPPAPLPLAAPPTLPAPLAPAEALGQLRAWHVPALPASVAGWAWVEEGEEASLRALPSAGWQAWQVSGGAALLGPPDLSCGPPALARQLWDGLAPSQRGVFAALTALTAQRGTGSVAVVGGALRDLLLGREQSPDLDLVVVGQPVAPLADALAKRYGVNCSFHAAYGNATLHLPGLTTDLVSARLERYPSPGAAPEVWPATLSQDLLRRDFALNALALRLTPAGPALHDPAGGLADLAGGWLRPLHPQSLREDASRLLRAARLAARLDLRAHPALLAQVPAALQHAEQTPRLWQELRLSLSEPQPGRVLRLLQSWGAQSLSSERAADLLQALDALPTRPPDIVYAAALLRAAPQLGPRLNWPRAQALLTRALSDRSFAPASPEGLLRAALFAPSYPSLRAADLLELGFTPGPRLGEALRQLVTLRRAGMLRGPDDERRAALDLLKKPPA